MKAILLDVKDNVATCTADVAAGVSVECIGVGRATVTSVEAIPSWHKIALRSIRKGDRVIKYGETIGEAIADIAEGGWVSHQNIVSVPRDYADEYINAGK